MPAYFPQGVPAEDPHSWANDTCFLTRLAREASDRYNNASPAVRSELQSGASLAPLSCVARVVDDSDEQVSQLLPRLSFHQYILKTIRKTSATLWHKWWHPNEISGSLVAQFGDNIDLSTVPVDQLRIALTEAINTGEECIAANIAAELARRREAPTSSNNNSYNNINSGSSDATTSALSRAQSVSLQRPTTRANSVENNNVRNQQNYYQQQVQKQNPFRASNSNHHFGNNNDDDNGCDEDRSGAGVRIGSLWTSEKPMWK